MLSAGLHEIVLVVKDVKRAAAFYREVIGLIPRKEPTDEWASFATISLDNPQWLGLRRGPLLYEELSPRPPGQRFGPIHFALRALDPDPDRFLRAARDHGATVYGPEVWDGMMTGASYYCFDPDDNLVEYWFAATHAQPAAISKDTHIRIARATDNLDAIVRFYTDGLGFEQVGSFTGHNGFDGVMLALKGAAYHIELTRKAGHAASRAPNQDSLLVFYLPDVEAWKRAVARMEQHGQAPVKSFNPYWDIKGRTFEDPDGYRVVLQNASWPT